MNRREISELVVPTEEERKEMFKETADVKWLREHDKEWREFLLNSAKQEKLENNRMIEGKI